MTAPYWNGRQAVCRCAAYDFPHRFGGGKCSGYWLAFQCFENRLMCNGCINLHAGGCDVINETESPKECPMVNDFAIEYELKI